MESNVYFYVFKIVIKNKVHFQKFYFIQILVLKFVKIFEKHGNKVELSFQFCYIRFAA